MAAAPRCSRLPARAFALPLVILLALVAALAAGVVLERQGTSYRAVERQVEAYRVHHRNLGMQEIADRWLQTTRGPIRERLEDDGLAFELLFAGGTKVQVYLSDGQRTVLRKLSGIGRAEKEMARDMVRYLEESGYTQDSEGNSVFRDVGPAKISVSEAPLQVLQAVCRAAAPEDEWERLARDLERKRREGRVGVGEVRSAAIAAGLSEEQIARIEMMFTVEPTLWFVEARSSRMLPSGRQRERHGGLMEVPSGPGTGPGISARFLTWDDLPDEE